LNIEYPIMNVEVRYFNIGHSIFNIQYSNVLVAPGNEPALSTVVYAKRPPPIPPGAQKQY
jgi:hypothetical protein